MLTNYKTLLIKQVLPGLVVLAVSFSEQGMNVFFPLENLPQSVSADERLSEAVSTDIQPEEPHPAAGSFRECELECIQGYSPPQPFQKTGFTLENDTYPAVPGAFWAQAAWNLLFINSASYCPGIRGSEIGLRSTLKSLSP